MLGRVCHDANHVLCRTYTTDGPWVTVTSINNSVRNPCKTYETLSPTSHYLDQCWPSCITSYCVIGCNELTTVQHQVHRWFNGYICIYTYIITLLPTSANELYILRIVYPICTQIDCIFVICDNKHKIINSNYWVSESQIASYLSQLAAFTCHIHKTKLAHQLFPSDRLVPLGRRKVLINAASFHP